MALLGSEALGLIVFFGVVPALLLFWFKNTILPFFISIFWLSGLFALAINLYYYIPQAFAGANIAAPLWAGSLIVLAAIIVVIFVSGYLYFQLFKHYQAQNFPIVTLLYTGLAIFLLALSSLLIAYAFLSGQGSYGSHHFLYAKPLWVIPALFALTSEIFRIKTGLTMSVVFHALASSLLLIGTLLFYRVYITVTLENGSNITNMPFFAYEPPLLSSLAVFATGILITFWNNRKQS